MKQGLGDAETRRRRAGRRIPRVSRRRRVPCGAVRITSCIYMIDTMYDISYRNTFIFLCRLSASASGFWLAFRPTVLVDALTEVHAAMTHYHCDGRRGEEFATLLSACECTSHVIWVRTTLDTGTTRGQHSSRRARSASSFVSWAKEGLRGSLHIIAVVFDVVLDRLVRNTRAQLHAHRIPLSR
jgi:hypothetical protein